MTNKYKVTLKADGSDTLTKVVVVRASNAMAAEINAECGYRGYSAVDSRMVSSVRQNRFPTMLGN